MTADRDALAGLLKGHRIDQLLWKCECGRDLAREREPRQQHYADVILASDWLAEHDARSAAVARKAALDPVRAFHDHWGSTDCQEVDQLDLWEQLGRILRSTP